MTKSEQILKYNMLTKKEKQALKKFSELCKKLEKMPIKEAKIIKLKKR
jgi:hypothetical protein